MPYYGVSHWSVARDGSGEIGMLALYMCFNGTGIWGGETILRGEKHDISLKILH